MKGELYIVIIHRVARHVSPPSVYPREAMLTAKSSRPMYIALTGITVRYFSNPFSCFHGILGNVFRACFWVSYPMYSENISSYPNSSLKQRNTDLCASGVLGLCLVPSLAAPSLTPVPAGGGHFTSISVSVQSSLQPSSSTYPATTLVREYPKGNVSRKSTT